MTSASTSSLTSSSLSSFTIGQENPNASNKKRKKTSSGLPQVFPSPSPGALSLKGREMTVKKNPQLPNTLVMEIFLYLERREILLGARVSRQWCQVKDHQIVQKELLNRYTFGKPQWNRYFGDIGEEPALPLDINEILTSPCPIWPGKRVEQTHILTLIPSKVNGESLNLETLRKLVKEPKNQGHATQYSSCVVSADKTACMKKNTWVLMTRDILPASRNQLHKKQITLIKQLAKKTKKAPYVVPRLIEAAVSIFTHYIRTGERLYTENPLTWMRCQERDAEYQWPMVIGKFATSGVCISDFYDEGAYQEVGLGTLRKW